MGYFGYWLVVRGARPSGLRRIGLEPASEEAAPGWRYAYGRGLPDDFTAVLARAALAGDGVVVGAWIFDSDWGQVIAVGPEHRAAIAVGADRAEAPLEHDPEAFADWSAEAPQPVTTANVEEIVSGYEVFVEDTVDELFDRLGLPAPYDPREQPTEAVRRRDA